MSVIFKLDRARRALFDSNGQRFDAPSRSWRIAGAPVGEEIDIIAAATWLQRESGSSIRVPVGVIGPREATLSQLQTARAVGAGLADIGFAIVCGGRHGVMEAVCEGAASHGGVTVGLLPDADPSFANPFVSIVVATGIGEARNALITRASLCLVAIGDSYGTLSEVALGRQFGKLVIGVDGAARVDGVVHVANATEAIERVALFALGV